MAVKHILVAALAFAAETAWSALPEGASAVNVEYVDPESSRMSGTIT